MTDKREVAEGIARLEGYLISQRELSNARQEAEAFARRMPWLTTSQQAEVVRLYQADRIALTRCTFQTIAARSKELKSEYTARYVTLRQQLLCYYTAFTLATTVLAWASVTMLR